ncbi:MAG TPA: carboxypeptidase-like regulatory domain-containing protein [Bryobacteraceae bacterium]|nr:carboxypeptidase-like regulatory domain-containing protein [Bryobacteraceae bacterium]
MRLPLLALAVVALALVERATAQTPPESTGAIEGQVTSLAGEPLRKASVTLLPAAPVEGQARPGSAHGNTAATGTDGKFAIEGIAAGTYMLIAGKDGYIPQVWGVRAPGPSFGKTITVQGGGRLSGMNITLTPQSILSGRTLDEDGDPTRAAVNIYKIGWPGGIRQAVRAGKGVVSPDDTYMAGDLTPGRYYVSASLPMPSTSEPVHEAYLETFYPHTTDIDSAIPIDIGPGEQVHGLDIRLIKGPLFHIRGKATGPMVTSSANVILQLAQKEGGPVGALGLLANVAPDGTFGMENVAAGAYVIQSGLSTAIASVPITIRDHDVDDLNVPVGSGITITGLVKTSDDMPPGSPLSFALRPVNDPSHRVNAEIAGNGTFEFHELRPERYQFSVDGLGPGTYVKSVLSGGTAIASDSLDLTAEGDASLRITLGDHAVSAAGIVRASNGDPAPNVMVALWAAVDGATRTAGTDADGRFQFDNLAPGDYFVAAWEELEDGLALNREFRTRFEGAAVKLSLTESAHQEIEITAISRGAVQAQLAGLP